MKILVYGLNFAPEPTGIGKYSGDMAAWLAAAGHELRVITAPPYYPAWRVDAPYSAWRSARETWRGLRIWRTPLWVPAQPSGMKRVLHLLSFALLSLPALARQLFWKPDVVIVIAPALACAPGGWLTARLCGAKAWLHIQDFEVDAAFRLGLLEGRIAEKLVSRVERWLLSRFDRVSTISQRMLATLRAKGVDERRSVLFPNWVDVGAILPLQGPSPYLEEMGIPPGAVVALYSGSIVGKQGLELLPAAARALRERLPNLMFVICGDGVFRPTLERECAGLQNVRMLPLQPAGRLGDLLGMADIHLLTQNADAADIVMPSKLTGMLSSGRAVLATAMPGTELARVLTTCGTVVPPNDLTAFTAALVRLTEAPALRLQLGVAGRRYAETHLARDLVLGDFERALQRCIGEHGAEPLAELPATTTDERAKTT